MNEETTVLLISAAAAYLIQWGWMRAQIAQLTRRLDEHNDVRERLARIEEKLNYIIKPHS